MDLLLLLAPLLLDQVLVVLPTSLLTQLLLRYCKEDDSVGKPSATTVPAARLVQWMHIGGIKLTLEDRDTIMNGQRLNDLIINFAQEES